MTAKPQTSGGPKTLAGSMISAWVQLYPDPETKRPGNPGARAALRHAGSPAAVLLEPAFHALLARMADYGFDFKGFSPNPAATPDPAKANRPWMRLALVAGLLAQRRDDRTGAGGPRFMRALGGSPLADERRLSSARFQSLMAALERGDGEESMSALRRAVKVLGDAEFNLFTFTDDLMNWDDNTRIKWTFDYFGRPRPASANHSPDAEEISA